jgi:hypothetical protein
MQGRNRWLNAALLLLAGPAALLATPCLPGTLAGYIALGSGGCTIQTNPAPFTDFLVKDFAFALVGLPTGSPAQVAATDIAVVPLTGSPVFSLTFSSPGFSVAAGQSIAYQLSYFIDPPPPVIHEFETEMWTETPVAPGFATIVTSLCIGTNFVSGVCSGTPAGLTVFHDGASHQLINSVTFAPTNALGVSNLITLDADAGGRADFAGFRNSASSIPEPGGPLLMAAALAMLAWRRRLSEPQQVLLQFLPKAGNRLSGSGRGQQA